MLHTKPIHYKDYNFDYKINDRFVLLGDSCRRFGVSNEFVSESN